MSSGAGSLPVLPKTSHSWVTPVSFSSGEPPAHIVLVDDDSGVRNVAAMMLRCAGYDVLTATDGLEAWDLLRRSPADLLITDHHMPGLTGLALIARARAWRQDLPTILISGLLDPNEIHPAHRPAIDAMLTKPFDSATLLGAVSSCLERARQQRHHAEAQHTPA